VGDDLRLILWDIREAPDRPSFVRDEAHPSFINCLSFSPHSEYLLVTGSADHTVGLLVCGNRGCGWGVCVSVQ
jgi:histone-binding protein RBBP4